MAIKENSELFNGHGVSVWNDEKFWRRMVVMVAQYKEKILNTIELYILKITKMANFML